MCHGLPQQAIPANSDNMFPQAPGLFTPDGMVTDDPVGVSYWKVQNGIRLSGMPSFKTVLSDLQMWDLGALLARADKLPPEALAALRPPAAPAATPPATAAAKPGKSAK